jgi:threonine dehydrogenase-like Zn-dependent dehydrogenase
MPVLTLLEPLCVGLHAVDNARLESGSRVAVLGMGPIGLTLLLGILQAKPKAVICSDIKKANLDMALSLGASIVVNPMEGDLGGAVETATQRGVDVCFVAVPSERVVAQALEITRSKGTVVVIALFGEPPRVDLRQIQLRERQLIGTLMYTRRDYKRAIELLPSLEESLGRLVTHRITIEQLPDTLDGLAHHRIDDSIKVVVDML